MELGTTVYCQQTPWIVMSINGDEITVKDENGMMWSNVPSSRFSLEPPPRIFKPVEEAEKNVEEVKVNSVVSLVDKKALRKRKSIWESPEKRRTVLERLVSNPSAYIAAAWLLKNNAHFHLSITPTVHEDGRLEDFVRSEILDVLDSDVSISTDLTQGPSFTATVGGIRPTDGVLKAFKDIGVSASKYYQTGTTVQKWGFVYDFMMVELGIGFNHNTNLSAVASRIRNEACRKVFLREIDGGDNRGLLGLLA